MKPLRTWVLVADGARARILENSGPGHALTGIEGLVFASGHAATHELVSDREGRSYSSHGHARSAIESRSDPHRELKTKFAGVLADMLSRELEAGAYQRLVLVAPPEMLGDLRAAISGEVRAKVVGESAHDLTKTPTREVAGHLDGLLLA